MYINTQTHTHMNNIIYLRKIVKWLLDILGGGVGEGCGGRVKSVSFITSDQSRFIDDLRWVFYVLWLAYKRHWSRVYSHFSVCCYLRELTFVQ